MYQAQLRLFSVTMHLKAMLLAALLAAAPGSASNALCKKIAIPGSLEALNIEVTARDIPPNSGVCERYKEHLDKDCSAWLYECYRRSNGDLLIRFTQSVFGCSGSSLNGVWWKATHNKYGSVKC